MTQSPTPPLDVPVLLIIYKRPQETAQVLAQLAKVRPRKLFVAADGPRTEADRANCLAARAVIDQVDWDCEVHTNYSDVNLRPKKRVPSALDWAFEHTEELIILEDDIVADPSFFWFCAELLERYRDNPAVMHIAATNYLVTARGYTPQDASYFFSRYAHVWGWATWRRAWQHYDPRLPLWRNAPDKNVFLRHFDRRAREFWRNIWEFASGDYPFGWDHGWVFTCFAHDGLCITPRDNLMTNIGFGPEATHTTQDHAIGHLPCQAVSIPLVHPVSVIVDERLDQQMGLFLWRLFDPPKPLPQQLRNLARLMGYYAGRAERKLVRTLRQLLPGSTQ